MTTYCVLSADHLYICHSDLKVCKLDSCSRSLLTLTAIDGVVDVTASVNLVVNPIKRFSDTAFGTEIK